ncbi:4'-phosphopantetheinyl transferase family protein [Aquimarina longa]|uniref:4'-phosphopantetheinyl transferase family protein n=1 Tax=Aquimarina longa TaxID=1080221 RepID=UPI000781F149|nr:4'-phosphopantetheinyl transferase superfamily protein [Aquimarina longa]
MNKGIIFFKREKSCFKGGFCVINKELSYLEKEISMLHPNEYAYYNTLRYDKRKTSYLLGKITAKGAISEILITQQTAHSILIQNGVFQFPVVKNIKEQNIQVSISHCDSYGVALAFPEEHPLGIDIEKISEDKIDVIKSYLCDKEISKLDSYSLTTAMGSTLMWTVKEGLSKILKTGLMIDFKVLEIETLEKIGTTYISSFKNFSQYKAISCHIEEYICSIVLPKNSFTDLSEFWHTLREQIKIVT